MAQPNLVPRITVQSGKIQITVRTPYPSTGMQLAWTGQTPDGLPLLEAFPQYIHNESSPGVSSEHTFSLECEKAPGQAAGGAILPLGRPIHVRLSAILQEPDGWRRATSENLTFRVVRDKLGVLRLGLNFEEGPRVLGVSATEAILQWKLNEPAASTFFYGLDAGKLTAQKGGAIGNTATVIINKLKPGRLYHYRVRCEHPNTGDVLLSPLLSFRTTQKDGGDFTFAVLGGTYADLNQLNPNQAINGVNVEVLNRCAVSAWRNGAEFLLCTGNAIAGDTASGDAALQQYRTWRRAVLGANQFIPVYAVMGQREAAAPLRTAGEGRSPDATAEGMFATAMNNPIDAPKNLDGLPPYTENVFTFGHAGARFIAVNSEYNTTRGMSVDDDTARTVDRTQRMWLRGQLEQYVKAPWLFVVCHGPAWPANGAYGTALDHLPGVRDQVWEMIDNFDVDAVFSGQEPNYSHTVINRDVGRSWVAGVHQFNTGSAGAPPDATLAQTPWAGNVKAFAARPHYLLVHIRGSRATVEARTPEGEVFDTVHLKRKKR